eukprot:scaffold52788_cov20-Tisochrysis_lutea.AAC.1
MAPWRGHLPLSPKALLTSGVGQVRVCMSHTSAFCTHLTNLLVGSNKVKLQHYTVEETDVRGLVAERFRHLEVPLEVQLRCAFQEEEKKKNSIACIHMATCLKQQHPQGMQTSLKDWTRSFRHGVMQAIEPALLALFSMAHRVEPTRPDKVLCNADYITWADYCRSDPTAPGKWFNEHPSSPLPPAGRVSSDYQNTVQPTTAPLVQQPLPPVLKLAAFYKLTHDPQCEPTRSALIPKSLSSRGFQGCTSPN